MHLSAKIHHNFHLKERISEYVKYRLVRLFLCIIKKKDHHTAHHCMRVMKLAVGYSQYNGYPSKNRNILKSAALLHDMGKILIPRRILNKPGKLSEKEFCKIKKHPLTGFFIMKAAILFQQEASIILHHHERIDGQGYPFGIQGNTIDEYSKILSVCDAFDAMTNHRVYRHRLSYAEALKELKNNAGTQFDKDIVDCFCSYIDHCTDILPSS